MQKTFFSASQLCSLLADLECCVCCCSVQFYLFICFSPPLISTALPLHPVLDVIRSIRDPEKPNTLEELDVVTEQCVEVQELGDDEYLIIIRFSPTVPHCSLATLIGEKHTHRMNISSRWAVCLRYGCDLWAPLFFVFVVITRCSTFSAGLCLQVKLQRCLPFKHKVCY